MLIRSAHLVEQLTTKQPAMRSLLRNGVSTCAIAAVSRQELTELRHRFVVTARLPRSGGPSPRRS